ncbi:TlpA family protein disulfide reductase [Subsaximicrobium wynnwilliamsii]|uniref:TlpA family protein disulfide reductase n=1 Tax=Subsaximicrobium wynnwilliamsii TaxID=291179 RepID=A0A5C6ZMV7_9FLAO|nr:TlpA disulfide reductase family protein [Subsaximicrobium wynnwilliamsii]TXD85239.1 TlpA family protein disulfide reductase [Subsaximicrobium wynnwilliamsii]TXD91282.1 TlpA family protein disulfide reductase [Subsaximicrobium wynnwilliamsii]TXE04675.1 TlpA family protein disulfide reductase [Subsaximicrobium wynnwilliamsii]
MKKLLLALCALSIVACQKDTKVDYALLTGSIKNTKAQKASLNAGDYNAEIKLAADGTFADTLRIPESGFYTLTIGREFTPMYLSKGDSVNVVIDATKFDESITYTGNGANENNYLAKKSLNDQSVMENSVEFYSLEEEGFKNKLAEMKKGHEATLQGLKDVDTDFLETEKQNLVYDQYALLQSYKQSHAYYTKKQRFEVSDEFFPEALKNMSYNDPKAYRNSKSYQQMAFKATMDNMFETIGNDIASVSAEDLKVIKDIEIQALKNDVISYLGGFLITAGNENMKGIYEMFIENTTDEKIKTSLTETFDLNKILVKGNPSPQFVNYENHKGGETSLSDLKGKYVYVDVWATWCAPCKREIPFLKEVEKKFQGQNVEFVSTSIDQAKDHAAWNKMVTDMELGGMQLFADNNWNSKFIKDYGIKGIPRFILIDPQGNIVSADAPRPSDPKLTELLESELKM